MEKFATEGGPEDKKGGGVWMSGGGLAQDSRKSHFILRNCILGRPEHFGFVDCQYLY